MIPRGHGRAGQPRSRDSGRPIITTQSSDLLDLLAIDELRVVSSTATGATIASVSERQRAIVKERLFSLGELHRSEGLEPDRPSHG
jgi:hypothetical protein